MGLGLVPFFVVAAWRRNPRYLVVETVMGAGLVALAGLGGALGPVAPAACAVCAGLASLALLWPFEHGTQGTRWLALPGTLAALACLCCYRASGLAWFPLPAIPVVLTVGLMPFFLVVFVRDRPANLLAEILVGSLLLAAIELLMANLSDAGSPDAVFMGMTAVASLAMVLGMSRRRDPTLARLAWIAVPLVVPLAVLPMTDTLLRWPAALIALAATAFLCGRSRRRQDANMAAVAIVVGLLASGWTIVALAKPFSHGGDPTRHLPLLAILIANYGAIMGGIGTRISAATPKFLRRLEAVTLIAGEATLLLGIALRASPAPIEALLVLLAFATLAGTSVLHALRVGLGWPFTLAESALGLAYGYLRVRTNWLDGLADWDGVAACLLALSCLGISRSLQRWRAGLGARHSETMAMLFPLLSPLFLQMQAPTRAIGTFASAAVYAWIARRQGRAWLGWLAGLMGNLGLISLWLHYGVDSPIAFSLPLGATLGLMAHLQRERLGRHAATVRTISSLLVFGATSWETFQFESAWPALVLALCAIGAVLLGIAWRVRVYLYAGFACLFLDIVANLTRFGLRDRLTAALAGLGAGMALLVLGIQVARHKAALLARYNKVRGWDW
jgi:hypothetical protein